jgi:rod shape-determining protein MreC
MAKRERTRLQKAWRVIAVLLLLVLMGLAAYSQFVGGTLPPENLIATTVGTVQRVFSVATDYVGNYLAQLKLRGNIEYEYNQLRALNDQLMYRALLAEELQMTNDYLLMLLGEYNERSPMNPLHARVIDSEPGNWFSVFMLDKGARDGVKTNMAVITPSGLVGNVVEVFESTCKVITVIDSNFHIGALLASTRDQGVVRGTLGIDGKPLCRMYYLPTTTVPRPGDNVQTSGVGLPFPKGLIIGTVRESTRSLEENKYYIVVEPAADFQHIEDVLILRYEPAAQAMPDGEEEEDRPIVAPPTPRPLPTIQDLTDVTPAPLPGAPGRATPSPSPRPLVIDEEGNTADAEDYLNGGDETFTPEEQAIRDAFLNGE